MMVSRWTIVFLWYGLGYTYAMLSISTTRELISTDPVTSLWFIINLTIIVIGLEFGRRDWKAWRKSRRVD